MRITVVASRHADRRNMEHLVYRVGEILSENHEVSVVGCSTVSPRIAERFPCRAWEEIRPGRLARLLCRDPISMRVTRLVRHCRNETPDVLLALGSIGVNGLAVALAGRMTGTPGVVRLTSDVFCVYRTKSTAIQKLRMFVRNNVLGRIALHLAVRILLLHEAQRREIEAIGVSPERLLLVPQPMVFPSTDDAPAQDVRRKIGITPDARIVLSTARLDPDKRPELLVDVIGRVLAEPHDPPIHFVIVGDGQCREAIEACAASHAGRVHALQELPRDELGTYYRQADVFLQLSKSEGLSNCLAEALYFGLPVIATDSGGITRGMISNVEDDREKIAQMIVGGAVKRDPLPRELDPDTNRRAWLAAVECQ